MLTMSTSKLTSFVRRLWEASPSLVVVGALMLAAMGVALVGLALDPRIISGAPAWLTTAPDVDADGLDELIVHYDPQRALMLDRDKIASMGLSLGQIGNDLAAMLGGNFINRFSIEGRSYSRASECQR